MEFVGDIKKSEKVLIITLPYYVDIKDGKYAISIEEYKNKRSLNQNNYYHKLVREICRKENGDTSQDDMNAIHTNLIVMANISPTNIWVREDALKSFQEMVKYSRVVAKNKNFVNLDVYRGSHELNKDEFRQLINQAIIYAREVGVDTRFYEEVFYG